MTHQGKREIIETLLYETCYPDDYQQEVYLLRLRDALADQADIEIRGDQIAIILPCPKGEEEER